MIYLKTGATLIIKDTNTKPYTYKEWYKLETKRRWKDVPVIVKDEYFFDDIEYIVDKNGEVKFIIDWK